MLSLEEPLQLLTPADEADAQSARYGRFLGFPFSATLRPGEVITGVRFELRYLPHEETDFPVERQLDSEFEKLTEQGDINVSIDSASASLTVYETPGGFADMRAWAVFKKFAHALQDFGYTSGDDCHYCQQNQGGRLVFQGGRVGQICQTCLEARAQRLMRAQKLDRETVPQVVKGALISIPAVACTWLIFWGCFDELLRWMGTIALPGKVWILGAIFLGIGLAFVAAFSWRKVLIPKPKVLGALATGSVVLGVAVGEICHSAWFVFRAFGAFSIGAAFKIYPLLVEIWSGSYLSMKVGILGL